MKRKGFLTAIIGAVIVACLAFLPATARADASMYPTPDNITFGGVPLSEHTPNGVTYDRDSGTLTLQYYDGGPISIRGYNADFTIRLLGTNTIHFDETDVYGIYTWTSNRSTLRITADEPAALKIYGESENSTAEDGFHGILSFGDLDICGSAYVYVNLEGSSNRAGQVFSGIMTDAGSIFVRDHSIVEMDIDVSDADLACGFYMAYMFSDLCIYTDEFVMVDGSYTRDNGYTFYGVASGDSLGGYTNRHLFIDITSSVTFYCNFGMCHIEDFDAMKLNPFDPAIPYYKKTWINSTGELTYSCEYIPMYRLYNKWTGEHYYTSDRPEKEYLVGIGWTDEGYGWYAAANAGVPVFRLYNSWAPGGDHHYTMDVVEYQNLVNAGWTGEGIGWLSVPPDIEGRWSVYREYNPYEFAHNHNYTTDYLEHEHLISLGWRDEGVGWYGYPQRELKRP